MKKHYSKANNKGFTLVEMIIVIVILGLIAALAIPLFAGTFTSDTEKTTFVTNLKVFASAAKCYYVTHDEHLEDSCSGCVPSGLGQYIDEIRWTSPTPIGGAWDTELDSYGVKSALGVHFTSGYGDAKSDSYMQTIDAMIDDGNLSTGQFRKLDCERFYLILQEN